MLLFVPCSVNSLGHLINVIGLQSVPQGPCSGATAQESLKAFANVTVHQAASPGLPKGCLLPVIMIWVALSNVAHYFPHSIFMGCSLLYGLLVAACLMSERSF